MLGKQISVDMAREFSLGFCSRSVTVSLAVVAIPILTMCQEESGTEIAGTAPAMDRAKAAVADRSPLSTRSVARCGQLLREISNGPDRAIRVRKILEDNLHWRGAPHQVFPKRIAVQRDIDAAYTALNESDIPVLVSLIGRGEVEKGALGLASGILGRFGPAALPCIEAGIAYYQGSGASDLRAIKINIDVEHRSSATPGSVQPQPERGGEKP